MPFMTPRRNGCLFGDLMTPRRNGCLFGDLCFITGTSLEPSNASGKTHGAHLTKLLFRAAVLDSEDE